MGQFYAGVDTGATSSTYSATAPGSYFVVVGTPAGTVTSQSANLTALTSDGVAVSTAPTITGQPQGTAVVFGGGQGLPLLSVSAVSLQALSYQWFLNGNLIVGATGPTYQTTTVGSYTVAVSTNAATATSAPAVVMLANRLADISGRAQVGIGANIAIAGFSISSYTGAAKQILIRGVGPSLSQFGLTDVLAQPVLSVFNSAGQIVASNAGWGGSPTITAAGGSAGAFPLTAGSADGALLLSLPPGTYTAQVAGAGGGTGIALAEVYDVTADAGQLANISTRAFVGTGGNILIGGLVAAGTQPSQVLIRGVGPGLAQFGLTGVLSQPVLSVYDGSGNLIAVNTGWSTGGSAQAVAINNAGSRVGAFPLQPGSADCAVLLSLVPGAYTAQVTGANGATGVALVEVYQVAP